MPSPIRIFQTDGYLIVKTPNAEKLRHTLTKAKDRQGQRLYDLNGFLRGSDHWEIPWTEEAALRKALTGQGVIWEPPPPVRKPSNLLPVLRPYQEEGIRFCVPAPFLPGVGSRSLVADVVGLGKALQAINWAMNLEPPVLIVVPVSLLDQWLTELMKFAGISPTIIRGSAERRAELWREGEWRITNFRTLMTDGLTHEQAKDENGAPLFKVDKNGKLELDKNGQPKPVMRAKIDIRKLPRDIKTLIVDEPTHREAGFKNHRGQTWRVANSYFRGIPNRMFTTASPIENNLVEMYDLAALLFAPQPHPWGTRGDFMAEHVISDGWGNPVRFTNTAKLKQTMGRWFIRRTKEEVGFQLPPVLDDIDLDPGLTKRQVDLYKRESEAFYDWVAMLKDEELKPLVAFTKLLRLIQVVSGSHIELDPKKDVAKINLFPDVLDMLPPEEKALLFVRTEQEVIPHILAEMFPNKVVAITGRTPAKDRQGVVQRFFEDSNLRVLAGNDGTIAYGFNFQQASVEINWDFAWNPQISAPVRINNQSQRIGRVHRGDQSKPITVINLITKGTIDEKILDKLFVKRLLSKEIIEDEHIRLSRKDWKELAEYTRENED